MSEKNKGYDGMWQAQKREEHRLALTREMDTQGAVWAALHELFQAASYQGAELSNFAMQGIAEIAKVMCDRSEEICEGPGFDEAIKSGV